MGETPVAPTPPLFHMPGPPPPVTFDGQLVLLKADDLSHHWADPGGLDPNWITFLNYVSQKEIRAALGVEGQSLVTGTSGYWQALRKIHSGGRFEFFNHGYTHSLKGADTAWHAVAEFQGTPYWFQKEHMDLTQGLLRACVGVEPVAFGAPGNATDAATLQVLEETPAVKIWFFGGNTSDKISLTKWIGVESPFPHPNFAHFRDVYPAQDKLILLQVHPAAWIDTRDFLEFSKIVDFLLARHATFITPSQYLEYLEDGSGE